MFRIFCKNQNEDGDDCTNRQEIVCAISPFYIEFIDDLIDDFISVRFNVIQVMLADFFDYNNSNHYS